MEDFLIIINALLFLYEFALILTNCLYIFYSPTTKIIKCINIVNILLFLIELCLSSADALITFIIRIINTIMISYIFYKNLPKINEQNVIVANNGNNVNNSNEQSSNDINYGMYF